jgi:RND family efflux transporter MFP subunit
VAAARARAQTARANLVETRQQLERERQLAARGVSPQAVATDLEARLSSLKAQVSAADAESRAAEAELEVFEVGLTNYKVTAPINGVVTNRPPEVGEMVGTITLSAQEPMLIVDFDSLVVVCDIPEGKLHLVRVDRPAEIVLDAFPGERHRGRVSEILPRIDRAKATAKVRVKFVDAVKGVLPDMSARVSILSEELDAEAMKEPPKVIVPSAAVADRGGAKVVFVVDDGTVKMVPVVLGEPFGNGLEVKQGPDPGTRVVKSPSSDLADGQKIKEKSE